MSTTLNELNFITAGDNEIYKAIENLIDINAPQTERQAEGYTIDFKEEWADKSLRVVASFANTFGGIIVIGVSESAGRADNIVGVGGKGELKTKIAGSISSNISPIPDYDIVECGMPSDPSRRLAVVRVRADNRLHYLLKKGEQPIYIRNVDQSIPALASELRASIENERNHLPGTPLSTDPFASPGEAFRVTRAKGSGTLQERKSRRSEALSYMKVAVRPSRIVSIPLDYTYEERFKDQVARRFPEHQKAVLNDIGAESECRSRNSYIYKVLEDGVDIEAIWSVTRAGAIGHASTVAITGHRLIWSLPDFVANLISSIQLADDVLSTAGYYGSLILDVELKPGGAVIAKDGVRGFAVLLRTDFYKHTWPIVIPQYQEAPLNKAGLASTELDFNQRREGLNAAVAQMVNEILRDLGYAVDHETLLQGIAGR
jgi:hypothetical protein